MNYIEQIREQNPLIHNITNTVVANFSANGLLALGASPAMANAPEEAAEMASHADALVLNIGTCTEEQTEAMILAGIAANQKGIPVVLDPVAVGATVFRRSSVKRILAQVKVTVIRGNAGEIAALGDSPVEMKGADSSIEEIDADIARKVAKRYGAVVISTGKTDVITDGKRVTKCENGVDMLPFVTGTGCLLTAVVGAFSSVSMDYYEASVKAVSTYGVAAELAVVRGEGPGTFLSAFIDQLFMVTEESVQARVKIMEDGSHEES